VGRESRMKKESGAGQGTGPGKGVAGGARGGAPGEHAPVVDRRAMEKTMSDIHRALAGQDFADMDEMNKFLADLMAKGDGIPAGAPATALEEAQDLMYEAWEATGARRAQLARKALEISPDCADAYVLLAEQKARTMEEARDFFAQGVAAGERALGPDVFKEDEGHFWGVIETRPYMRAREGLAGCLWKLGEREAAVGHYKEMLRLNPHDNQGVRYVLVDCLLAMSRDEDAGALLAEYEDDGTAAWLHDYALWAFRREGDSPESRRRLKEAFKQNRHVPAYLLGRKRLPARLPDFVGFGDENEAVAYVADALANWQATDGALSWLAGTK
jgi:tetratricopeptide (TPR) repeat protein